MPPSRNTRPTPKLLMWVSDVAVSETGLAASPDEGVVSAALVRMLDAAQRDRTELVQMVVDARPPDLRDGATANYKLQRLLHLSRAAPVVCWSPNPRAAWQTLNLLLELVPDDRCALLVAGGMEPPFLIAGALVWPDHERRKATFGLAASPTSIGADSFLQLLISMAASRSLLTSQECAAAATPHAD